MTKHRQTWTAAERAFLKKLKTPEKIQSRLNDFAYNTDEICRSPRMVMKTGKAHCMDGALFAAAALRFHGFGCRLLDMVAVRDDDHVIALYRKHNCWGAVAKSNFSGLRFREPVYRTLRELVMSYFDNYFNTAGEKTLREYSRPLDLRKFDSIDWMTTQDDLDLIGDSLNDLAHTRLLAPAMIRSLSKADKRMLEAGLLGSDPDGLYKV